MAATPSSPKPLNPPPSSTSFNHEPNPIPNSLPPHHSPPPPTAAAQPVPTKRKRDDHNSSNSESGHVGLQFVYPIDPNSESRESNPQFGDPIDPNGESSNLGLQFVYPIDRNSESAVAKPQFKDPIDPKSVSGDVDPKFEDPIDQKSELHPFYKTSLCSYFRRHPGGVCSHGKTCRFAHGEEELRMRPDKTWDPTSERAKKAVRVGVEREEEERVVVVTEDIGDEGNGLSKCLVHLPRKWDSERMRSFLSEKGVPFKSAKKKKGMTVGFMTFESQDQLKSAVEFLDGVSVGNKNIKVADVMPRSYDDKIKEAQSKQRMANHGDDCEGEASPSSNNVEDSEKVDGSVSKQKCARDVVTPLADIPYAEQLEQKKNSLSQLLKRLTRNAKKACPNGVPLPQWINKSREIGGLPCKLEGILESPLTNGYRNKCEFSVGYSVSGKVTVGFLLGNFREGVTAVEEPVNCPNVSSIASRYASIFQEFIWESSLPVWNRFKNTGFWRQLTVREGRNLRKEVDFENPEANILEVMLVIQICSTGFGDDIINSELKRMSESFATEATSSCPPLPLTALVVQDHQGISNAAPADAPLRPLTMPTAQTDSSMLKACTCEARIHDYISSLRFSISPTAFFQVNTLAAEKLYSLAGDWASLDSDTLLFDVCCGTGTIGLTLAPRVGMVVGIEMNASAVSDAHRNAKINGIKNCRFVCAKAEDVLDYLLNEYLNEPQPMDEALDLSELDGTNPTSAENGSNPDEPLREKAQKGVDASGPDKEELELPETQPAANGAALMQQTFKNVVAIVDPPRGGLHPTVIKTLRTHPWLRRLVYISCNPETLVANAIELCTPSAEKAEKGNKRNQGWRNMSSASLARHRAKSMPKSEPFVPIKAMAVDLFPHTSHCEMVMLLER
ncbi:hypothetical protein Droror1_Dr00019541 [Drosera rotundifolia]